MRGHSPSRNLLISLGSCAEAYKAQNLACLPLHIESDSLYGYQQNSFCVRVVTGGRVTP